MKKLTRREKRAVNRVEGKETLSAKLRRINRVQKGGKKYKEPTSLPDGSTSVKLFESMFLKAMKEQGVTEEEALKYFTPTNLTKVPTKSEVAALLKKHTGEAYDKHVSSKINFFSSIYWHEDTETYRVNDKDRDTKHHRLATQAEMEELVGFIHDAKVDGEDKDLMLNHMIIYIEQVLKKGHGNLKQSTPTLSKLIATKQAQTRFTL